MKIKLLIVIFVLFSSFVYGQKKGKKKKNDGPVELVSLVDSVSYSLGRDIGEKLKQMGATDLNIAAFQEALLGGLRGDSSRIPSEEGMVKINSFFQGLADEKSEKNKKEGEAFLETNKNKEGVHTTESGLQYIVLKKGTGTVPGPDDKVRVHYTGTLIDGQIFDSSVERGEPAEFPIKGVIQGWQEILQLMPVGSKWKVFIPSELGYGKNVRRGGPIEANMVLIFEIELLDIVSDEPIIEEEGE